MGALRPLAICRDYGEMHAAFREYVAHDLNVTYETLDHVSGLQSGYISKLLAPLPIKNFGIMSLDAFLNSACLALIVAQDQDALARMRHRLPVRQRPFIAPTRTSA
jgi:hypothetical protein